MKFNFLVSGVNLPAIFASGLISAFTLFVSTAILRSDVLAAELRIKDENGKALLVVDAQEGSTFRIEARGSVSSDAVSSDAGVTVSIKSVSALEGVKSEFKSGVAVFNNVSTGEYIVSTSSDSLKITSLDAVPSSSLVSGSGLSTAGDDSVEVSGEGSGSSTTSKAAYVTGAAAVAGAIGAIGASSEGGIFSSSSRGENSAREGSGSSSSGTDYNPAVVQPRDESGSVGAFNNPSFDQNRPSPGPFAPFPSVFAVRPGPFPFNPNNPAVPIPSANVNPFPSVFPSPFPPPPSTNPITPS
ncbi:MAG TPA: hypothetical protein PKA63_06540 [Oligoflexia bacterium]|nr:hypothetical protein [Oligoflexia bacterium]HMP48307.1 hypothetical protein [Oligoflexia bacterium]